MLRDGKKFCIERSDTMLNALLKMDQLRIKLLIITVRKKYFNLLSIGDIQRALIEGFDLNQTLSSVDIDKKVVASESTSFSQIKELMSKMRSDFMPVVKNDNELVGVYLWKDVFLSKVIGSEKILDKPPVVIMAGGKGTRLKPLSNVLPKPLTPIGEKTIVEEIIHKFTEAGCSNFYMSVNYKKELIQYYMDSIEIAGEVSLFSEDIPLGTAGSLHLLDGEINQTFFVTNCDILIDQDLNELYEYHKQNKNELTLVAAVKTSRIAYGTVKSGVDGLLESIEEKPSVSYQINTGVYVLEPHLLNEIPKGEFFHITHLIDNVHKRSGRVGVFPIPEGSWKDIGEWPEYIKTVKDLSEEESFVGIS